MQSTRSFLLGFLLSCTAFVGATLAQDNAGAPGQPGLAIKCAKALVMSPKLEDRQVVDNALVLVKDGKIEAVVPARGAEVPKGYEFRDVGKSWVMPGIIDLHTHEGGTYDINEPVYMTNPGLSCRVAIRPYNDRLRVALASGVTSILFIPGSAANMTGKGILMKTGHDKYEKAIIRDPGSLKVAQWGNPESWGPGVAMSLEDWNTRRTFEKGKAYAKRWVAFEKGLAPEPKRLLHLDIFRALYARETQCAVHTQMYQVVLETLTMIARDLDLPVYLDHSTIGGWLAGELAVELEVPVVAGPREADTTFRGMINWCRNQHEGWRGVAAGYQERGVTMLAFNTDAPVLPLESVSLQSGMAVRYGLDDTNLATVRGLTVIPAMAATIDDRVGHLTPGLDADFIVITGHPSDPRSHVQAAYLDGEKKYDTREDHRLW